MDIEDSNKYGTLNIEELDKYEKSIGAMLPEDFRDFLILHNGGTPDKYLVCWPDSDDPSEVWNDSLGLHNGPTYLRLDSVTLALQEYLPKGIIPFASDPGGNHFCIGTSGDNTGNIYFWDHELASEEKSVSFLSESFTKFVSNLVGDEDA